MSLSLFTLCSLAFCLCSALSLSLSLSLSLCLSAFLRLCVSASICHSVAGVVAIQARARIVDEGRAVEPLLKAGDCLLFENRCFHSVGINRSDSIRKTFVVGYSYRWMRPDDYNTQSEEFLSRCNPLERELCVMNGMNIGRDGVWKAGGDPTLLEEIFLAHHGHKTAATF